MPGLTGAVARHELIELLDIVVRHLGRRLGVGVFHAHRDDALLRDRDAGCSREMLERVLAIAISIALLEAELVHDRLPQRAAPQDRQQDVAVRRERRHGQAGGGREPLRLLEEEARAEEPPDEVSATLLGRHQGRRRLVDLGQPQRDQQRHQHRHRADGHDHPAMAPHDRPVTNDRRLFAHLRPLPRRSFTGAPGRNRA